MSFKSGWSWRAEASFIVALLAHEPSDSCGDVDFDNDATLDESTTDHSDQALAL